MKTLSKRFANYGSFILVAIAIALAGCTKHYLTSQMLSYKVTGDGAYLTYYSNADRSTHTVNVTDCDWTYQEIVQPGDSIQIFMMPGYPPNSSLQIFLGTNLLYEGSPDSTGFLSLKKKFYSEDFKLHTVH